MVTLQQVAEFDLKTLQYSWWTAYTFVPHHLFMVVFYFAVASADCLPPRLRRPGLRFAAPIAVVLQCYKAAGHRPPLGDQEVGHVWYTLGALSLTSLDVAARTSPVLVLLTFRGAWNGVLHPDRLAFLRSPAVMSGDGPPAAGRRALGSVRPADPGA